MGILNEIFKQTLGTDFTRNQRKRKSTGKAGKLSNREKKLILDKLKDIKQVHKSFYIEHWK